MIQALIAYRFLVGIGVGGEYPAGSVACAENTNDLKRGHRNRWFVFAVRCCAQNIKNVTDLLTDKFPT